mmetsp:Transcript_175559/g.563028  ORF Transcript_175559/g.563028 Transcript_175559/m.563028 type:complete len:304 (+) Transcript_175559:2367-3278(+)
MIFISDFVRQEKHSRRRGWQAGCHSHRQVHAWKAHARRRREGHTTRKEAGHEHGHAPPSHRRALLCRSLRRHTLLVPGLLPRTTAATAAASAGAAAAATAAAANVTATSPLEHRAFLIDVFNISLLFPLTTLQPSPGSCTPGRPNVRRLLHLPLNNIIIWLLALVRGSLCLAVAPLTVVKLAFHILCLLFLLLPSLIVGDLGVLDLFSVASFFLGIGSLLLPLLLPVVHPQLLLLLRIGFLLFLVFLLQFRSIIHIMLGRFDISSDILRIHLGPLSGIPRFPFANEASRLVLIARPLRKALSL